MRPEAVTPAAAQAEQPPAEHVRGEVLLGDRRLAALPALAELVEVGEDDVREDASTVATAKSRSRIACAPARRRPSSAVGELGASAAGRERGVLGLRSGSGRERRRLRGGEPRRQVALHRPHALEVVGRVQPQPARRAGGAEQAVAPLPCAQELRADARRRLSSPIRKQSASGSANYTESGQDLDNDAIARALPSLVDKLSTGGVQQ